MKPIRPLVAVLLLGLLGAPLVLPLLELLAPGAWTAWREIDRVAGLAWNTVGLSTLTLLLSVPPGILLAVLLHRTDLPGRVAIRSLLVVALFVPLPLYALAWQSAGGGTWRPWNQGLLAAAMVHAAAALPWVVWLTGLGLRRVDPELEEFALTVMPALRVLWRVSIPLSAPAIGLAVIWVFLQTAGEITVTDLTLVRTFAEEVYTQFVAGGADGLGRAVAVFIPPTLLVLLVVAILMSRWGRGLAIVSQSRPAIVFPLGRWRWPLGIVVGLAIGALVGVPLSSLFLQAGGGDDFQATRLGVELRRALRLHWTMILDSLLWAGVAGIVTTGLALLAAWVATDSKWFRRFLLVLAVALWAVPGPVLGFGLKAAIERFMDLEDLLLFGTSVRPMRAILYDLPTPLPVLWAHVARLFPYAVAILWPAVRDVPRDLREAARADGAPPVAEFRRTVWPAVRGAAALSVLAVMALALGELGASKLVQVPGRQTFAQELFNQMHYGATPTTAALALLQLGLALIVVSAARIIVPRPSRSTR